MAATEATPAMAQLGSLLSESSFSSCTPTDAETASSNIASLSSTPPTTVSPDSMSLASELDVSKPESVAASSIEAAVALPDSDNGSENVSDKVKDNEHDRDRDRDTNHDQDHGQDHDKDKDNEQRESGLQTPVGQDAIVVAEPPPPAEPASTGRPRRARSSLPVYNLSKLAGTDTRGRRRSKGDAVQERKRRTAPGAAATEEGAGGANGSADAPDQADASGTGQAPVSLRTTKNARVSKKTASSPPPMRMTRRATRLAGVSVETLTTKLSALTRRGKKAADKDLGRLTRELKRLQDTDEFARIDTRPVHYTVWSNGKCVDVDPAAETAREPPRKKVKVDKDTADGADNKADAEKQESSAPVVKKPRVKKWLEKGLYAGQEAPTDIFRGLTAQERKKLASLPELLPSGKPNKMLPMPMFNGLRILIQGRDFKLPFDVCHPLPPGQPKPAAYRTMTKSEYPPPCCRCVGASRKSLAVACTNALCCRPLRGRRGRLLEEDAAL